MKKLTKKNISGTSVELFEAKYRCPCSCPICTCSMCNPNDTTWMDTVYAHDDENYGTEGVYNDVW